MLNSLLENNKIPEEKLKDHGRNLMKLIYFLDEPKIGFDLLTNNYVIFIFELLKPNLKNNNFIFFLKIFKKVFTNYGFVYFILMNKLMIHEEYNQVLNLFEMQLPFFNEERVTKTNVLIKSMLPYDQMSLVLEALLCLVIIFFQF